jgi:hypothetical protein
VVVGGGGGCLELVWGGRRLVEGRLGLRCPGGLFLSQTL